MWCISGNASFWGYQLLIVLSLWWIIFCRNIISQQVHCVPDSICSMLVRRKLFSILQVYFLTDRFENLSMCLKIDYFSHSFIASFVFLLYLFCKSLCGLCFLIEIIVGYDFFRLLYFVLFKNTYFWKIAGLFRKTFFSHFVHIDIL